VVDTVSIPEIYDTQIPLKIVYFGSRLTVCMLWLQGSVERISTACQLQKYQARH